jgi:hypothetical protein
VFDFDSAGDSAVQHYIIAGEDVWETAGCWTADWMVRLLAADDELAEHVLSTGAVHVVPLASPYSATLPGASYTDLDGKGLYGAATWGDPVPPPEYAMLRDEVEGHVTERVEWAEATMASLTRGVPTGRYRMSDKIWHPGLARDYLLGTHNAATFRIEVTTVGQGPEEMAETARGILEGMGEVESWEPVLH